MRTIACLVVSALLGCLAVMPAGAAQRAAGPEPTTRATAVNIGFVTRPLIRRTIVAAKTVRLSYQRYTYVKEELGDLLFFWDYYKARQRAHKFCEVIEAAFPSRYYVVGNTVVSYAYDRCDSI